MAQRTRSAERQGDSRTGMRPVGAVAGPMTRHDPVLGRGSSRASAGFYRRAWVRYSRNKVAVVGLVVLMLIVLFALGAGVISTLTGNTYTKNNLSDQFLGPTLHDRHYLGTDANGRDVLVRLAYAGRISLVVASLAAATTLLIGATIGSVAGYFGGFVDSFLMRLVDVLLSVPGLPLLILVFALFYPSYIELALIIAALGWPGIARVIRGEVLGLRSRDYVDAARVVGASDARIIARHIMPNVVPIMLVWISLAIPGLILTEAALSFLGFGVQIPTPTWGNMLENANEYFKRSWTNVFFPGLMIYITVLSVNLVGNGLRDALDPRLNQ